jgi:predicted RNase H-like HicB family nuclease/uncharacterized damage-inducible protein DinB
MVHVLDLLGCIAQGPTTERALDLTPETIRCYLRFLRRHGDPVDPDAPFSTSIAVHVTKGPWLGQGDPAPGFAPDFQPMSSDDLHRYLLRLSHMHDDLLQSIDSMPAERLSAEPANGGRPIGQIVAHLVESECSYVRATVGKVAGMPEAQRAVQQSVASIDAALPAVWRIAGERLAAMSPDERTQLAAHGQVTWSARRGLRRMLEHNWEHLLEIERRLGNVAAS